MIEFLDDPDVLPIAVDFHDLDGEVEQMLAGFDQCRKRVTGRHRVVPSGTPPASVLSETVPFPVRLSRHEVTAALKSPATPSGTPSRRGAAVRGRMVSTAGHSPSVKPGKSASVLPLPPFSCAVLPVEPLHEEAAPPANQASGMSSDPVFPPSLPPLPPPPPPLPGFLSPVAPLSAVSAALSADSDRGREAPSLTLVSALPENSLNEWLSETEERIAARDLGAMLEAVFWAHPGQKLPAPVRMRLVNALYAVGHDSSEVQRLATQLALARHEPHEPIRRASLCFLNHLFHVLPSLPSQVLLTFLQAADPGEEPRESVRTQAYAFMSLAFPYWSSVRQQVYRILWLRLEPSFVCRLFLLERLLEWLPEPEATERERLEGLYLLQRALADVNESAHLRISLACKLRHFDFGFLAPEVRNFIRLQLLPLCQQVLSDLAPPTPLESTAT